MSVIDVEEDLQSWGWTDLSSSWSAASDSDSEPGAMSRRSLRLDDSRLDRKLPLGSASYSVGGNGWTNNRALKSRCSRQLSASCSESFLAHTPRKPSNLSLHSDVSDASLISSLLDESAIQECSVVDALWGLDHDLDPKESTIIEEQSSVLANSTLIGSDGHCPKHLIHTLPRVSRKGCECDRRESGTANLSSSSKRLSSPAFEASDVYCRDRSRRAATDVPRPWLDSFLGGARTAAARCRSALARALQMCRADRNRGARTGHGGDMSAKHGERLPNGSLCELARTRTHSGDDCKEQQHAEQTRNVGSSRPARASTLCWLLRNVSVFTAWCLRLLTSWLWALTRTMSSSSHAAGKPVKRGGAFQLMGRRWSDTPLLTWFLLSLLLVLLTVFSLCWFSFAGLPAVSVLEWKTSISDVPALSSVDGLSSSVSRAAGGVAEDSEEKASAESESVRLARLERSLASLRERVEAGDELAELRRGEMLQMHSELQRHAQRGELRLSGLLERQLARLRRRMDEDRRQRQRELLRQQSQMSRLDLLEAKLRNLAAKAEEATSGPATLSDVASVAVDRQSHDALLAEVGRLAAALKDIGRDVEALLGCQQLDQETISAQVHQQVLVLLYGKERAESGFPDSLLRWLSERYVAGADPRASLAAPERGILRNDSRHLDRRQREETAGKALTREDVDAIVKRALRLFSHDRTGLADYALESGGGSILSTRCSETYETKAALLSLFGVPLWYFSQSPRVVIQPNVHPGNCWAFRGSTGFLVIRLSMSVVPSAFSLEHIPKSLAPSGTLRSAPRHFAVYGLADAAQDRGTPLGSYAYEEDGEALQTFYVTEENERAFQIIEVQVLSNWGHEEYTCMYRFRVHGSPRDA
ncbi:SUN domain-containing protein 2-like isoform X2 [Phyllopteryx taeniolatus]|uniref:SUN domain-containing protein 2-like isoform X2 n=1 Tax=Phyllopteryx taeniolatus TaxID=161469 RepID=UPI002AD528D8|nr:SUN domain-containing protein 2-like isoform X2 [Phyllopteryx taeniolatus]